MSSNAPLLEMLVEDLSSKFLKECARRIPTIYQESVSRSLNDDAVDDALKPYYFGHTRYALIQTLFLDVGRECGHEAKTFPCDTNGFPIPIVRIGRFHFTTHHAGSDDGQCAMYSSEIRKQHSQINDEYVNPSLFGCTFDEAKLRSAQSMFANFIYGCRPGAQDFAAYGFLQIAIPYVKTVKEKQKVFYAAKYQYSEVLRLVLEKEKIAAEQKPIVNVASPKLKKSQKPS